MAGGEYTNCTATVLTYSFFLFLIFYRSINLNDQHRNYIPLYFTKLLFSCIQDHIWEGFTIFFPELADNYRTVFITG